MKQKIKQYENATIKIKMDRNNYQRGIFLNNNIFEIHI